jgi:hypothetical protein
MGLMEILWPRGYDEEFHNWNKGLGWEHTGWVEPKEEQLSRAVTACAMEGMSQLLPSIEFARHIRNIHSRRRVCPVDG